MTDARYRAELPLFSRLPATVDLGLLLQALARIEAAAWKAHFNTGYYEGEWSGVTLLAPANERVELALGTGETVERDAWCRDPRWAKALAYLDLDIRSARLLRLGPGSKIHPHRDYDLDGPEADRRLHIPLVSSDEVDFMLQTHRVPMRAGELWFLDLARPHSVDNWGTAARVHLVLDCRPGDWLDRQIQAGLDTTPTPGVGRAARDFATLRSLLHAQPHLCEPLQAITEAEAFVTQLVELGRAQGLSFGAGDVRAAMREGRRSWSQQWTA